jgi:hypothetical protein
MPIKDVANSESESPPPVGWAVILPAALLVGLVAGVGAVVFRGLIGFFHNLLFLGQLGWNYDANVHTPPSPWGTWVVLVPVIGAVGVAFLVKTFAPEAKGHGVPEVMDAVQYRQGLIRPVVAAVKSLASALSIGSGGSVGREGPIVQIGAAFGSGPALGASIGGHPLVRGRLEGFRDVSAFQPRLPSEGGQSPSPAPPALPVGFSVWIAHGSWASDSAWSGGHAT